MTRAESMADRPEVILVHGAANSASVWRFWQQELGALSWRSHAIDLRGHGAGASADLSSTSMRDYADDVAGWAEQLSPKPIVIGWSMGGLVAMMVAAAGFASACVALAPSAPARQVDEHMPLRHGAFGSEEYGITSLDVADQPAMLDLDAEERAVALASLGLESRFARDERKRGVAIHQLRCPLLIVTGEMEPERQPTLYYDLDLPAEYVNVEGSSHWGLVLNRRALARTVPAVSRWMARAVSA
jgi:pimeloyl-ACP methyl ester carboxylesterase